jgi:hypothetical protein
MLIEASWCSRRPAREGRRHLERAAHLPERIRDIGSKAQTRLCGRFRRLSGAGKPLPKMIAAVAREVAGFVWSITREQPLRA